MIKTPWLTFPFLAGLVILPRLSVDLYLPSLPHMLTTFHTSQESLQMTMTIFMFGYAFSMLVAGPLSDNYGRKKILLASLLIFLIATITCILSHSITILTVARFFQALGGCSGTVIARVMVRDFYSREEQIQLLAYLSAAMAVCPLIAPILGGWLQLYFDWRIVFYFLGIFGLILFILSNYQLQETHIQLKKKTIVELLQNYRILLTHKSFIVYSLSIGLAWCAYFSFTLESPFLLQKTLQLNSVIFGILFSVVVFGYLVGTQVTRKLGNKVNWDKLILIASLICLLGASIMTTLTFLLPLSWPNIVFPMMIVMIGVGIIIPCTQAAVMQPFPQMAGTASGLFFFIQMALGGITGLIVQSFKGDSPLPMVMLILISSLLLVISFYGLIWHGQYGNKKCLNSS